MRPTTSPAQPSPFSPFGQKGKKSRRARGNAYGRYQNPLVARAKVSGLDTDGMMQWAKDNKWYLLGGGLLLAAGIAFLKR